MLIRKEIENKKENQIINMKIKGKKRKLNLLSQRFKSKQKVSKAENTKAKTFQF
jgi:hypothetical protein